MVNWTLSTRRAVLSFYTHVLFLIDYNFIVG